MSLNVRNKTSYDIRKDNISSESWEVKNCAVKPSST